MVSLNFQISMVARYTVVRLVSVGIRIPMPVTKTAKKAAAKRATLHDLFRTLLHELMTAQTRVHTLDFQQPPSTT